MTTTDGFTIDNNSNDVVMIFKSSLVQYVASPQVRLPSNFVGVRCVRRERECNSSSKNTNTQSTSDDLLPSAKDNKNDDDDDDNVDGGGDDENVARNNKYVKFVVVDENGNERRMTKAEKKKKKRQLAKENKEQAQQNTAKKQKLEEGISSTIPSSTATAMATEGQEGKSSLSSSSSYHQLPINPTTMDQELADFQGERAGLPTVLLSPPMALQFFSKNLHALPEIIPLVVGKEEELLNDDEEIVEDAHNNNKNNNNYYDTNGDGAVLIHSQSMAEDWSNRLKEKCILPAESVRQKEDLRPLAYRLHPEPWQRMRPTPIKEQPMLTTSRSRNRNDNPEKEDKKKSLVAKTSGDQMIVNPNPRDWITLTCRPRLTSSSSSSSSSILQHDDILSIVFEYIHRETPFYLSCGAKFGSDYLIYDGPRESRHAFAGLRVLSRFTNSMTSSSSSSSSSLLPTTDKDRNASSPPSPSSELQLPLPTAFSLTSFVRCLNTAGKLALLATVEEVQVVVPDNNEEQQEGSNGENDIDQNDTITRKINNNNITTHYRVAFVDVALEKVLDVHKRKKGSSKKKLQKRRDVTQNLAKK